MTEQSTNLSIYTYKDYRSFLVEATAKRKKIERGVLTSLAGFVRVHPTLISQILSGAKDFTVEQALLVSQYFGLLEKETDYFVLLVQHSRAGSHDSKKYFERKCTEFRNRMSRVAEQVETTQEFSEIAKATFYSSWIYPVIHIASTLDRPMSAPEIAKTFNIEIDRVIQAIDFMIENGILKYTDGKISGGPVSTHIGKDSPFLAKKLMHWRVKALEKIDTLPKDQLMYSTTVSLSNEDFEKLQLSLIKQIQDFLAVVKLSPAQEIAQLNIDFFKL